ncbi:hypothetical protein [Glaciecola petra]|uniref:Uncharacterized protein n=1 Tax=Glaciecola petra TaxID=3075602 RepID=A0ABU2ZV53_9ALTE|nr:hypothetical protein [Aestuariibacter sp. P117]MDT0596184.1 hypothetical protein [Aestuariibacter sp. P117]
MHANRPLFKHIRNHSALFSSLANIRNEFAEQLNPKFQQFNKTPKFISENGSRLSIEPERSVVLNNYRQAIGLKTVLTEQLVGFDIVTNSDIGFRYPTAALAGLEAPYIKRFRSEYFHRVDEKRDICRPINLSYGIKSRGKADNREEYEVWIPEQDLKIDPAPLFIDKYAEDLPQAVRKFASETPIVHGWMGVKRCAFEGIYHQQNKFSDIAICLSLSLDAYNIGAKPDLSLSTSLNSSIARGGAEIEWEVIGYYAPKGYQASHDEIWSAISAALQAVYEPINRAFQPFIVATEESKTERILSTMRRAGVTTDYIKELNLKPWEFLETQSIARTKSHDANRNINLLGRLNRLFYNPDIPLPSLREMHFIAEQSL